MININGKSWEDLTPGDIKTLLAEDDGESFFFEYKSDPVTTTDLMKEISAFSNTYGGYILLGINDDKSIGGCKKWTEERINTSIRDGITPVPQFDVRKFAIDEKVVLILKIEEGALPPYITNKGFIFERISSSSSPTSSSPIKESYKLIQLFQKREDQIEKTHKKIDLPDLHDDGLIPVNLCGYVDIGFSMTLSEPSDLQKNFYNYDLTELHDLAAKLGKLYRVSRVGHSYVITAGDYQAKWQPGEEFVRLGRGIYNFIEIMCDGSVRARALIFGNPSDPSADIASLFTIFEFKEFYRLFFQDDLLKKFIYAQKYQKLTVLKQFIANSESSVQAENCNNFQELYYNRHVERFGEPLIVEGNRIPPFDFEMIDRRYIEQFRHEFSLDTLLDVLFENSYDIVGYTS